jgi:hypothetical protein
MSRSYNLYPPLFFHGAAGQFYFTFYGTCSAFPETVNVVLTKRQIKHISGNMSVKEMKYFHAVTLTLSQVKGHEHESVFL